MTLGDLWMPLQPLCHPDWHCISNSGDLRLVTVAGVPGSEPIKCHSLADRQRGNVPVHMLTSQMTKHSNLQRMRSLV